MESDRADRSLVRKLAHELRDALSPLASSTDLARLRGFDVEASRLLAEQVERGLRRAQTILDAFVLAEDEAHAPTASVAISAASNAPRLACAAGAPLGQRILLVDDSLDVRRSYREALSALGYAVVEAVDAEQALGALEGDAPDIALIDIHLPRMNGFRLAQTIRARVGAAIYLVMLSGMSLDAATRTLAREAGFDECLDKMAGPVALREMLRSAAASGTRRTL
jgi:CheY-like chemotaxis protein